MNRARYNTARYNTAGTPTVPYTGPWLVVSVAVPDDDPLGVDPALTEVAPLDAYSSRTLPGPGTT